MMILLSPAKTLDYDTPLPAHLAQLAPTLPHFAAQAAALVALLRQQPPQELARLMKLSAPLAALNAARYQAWSPGPGATVARPALLAFNGGVYAGLQARTLDAADLAWAQQRVALLSGLYGVLRPLDGMQPHRLEMGTRLVHPAGTGLYAFWGARIAGFLDAHLQTGAGTAPASAPVPPVVLNLASQEYARAVDRKALRARWVDCVFEEEGRGGAWQVVGVHAKRARGLMARHAIVQRASGPQQLEGFGAEGYAFAAGAGAPDRLVFRRRAPC